MNAGAAVREVELKLRVPGLFELPDIVSPETGVARARRQVTRSMHAVYYDTADLRLFRWGITLRRREGGNDAGWHLKLPVPGEDGSVRDEIRRPLGSSTDGVPGELARGVLPVSRGETLVPVVELRTERVPYVLYDSDGIAFAELVDDTVAVWHQDTMVEQFRELEIEALFDGAPIAAVAEALHAAGGQPVQASKAASALGPRARRPADVLPPVAAGPDDPAVTAIVAFLRRQARAFISQDVRVRFDLPDSVHQMRVAARRLRSGLKAFEPLLAPEFSASLRTELGRAASELGQARDTEVLLERLMRSSEALSPEDAQRVQAVIDSHLRERLAAARTEAISSLSSDRHLQLVEQLVAASADPPVTAAADRACSDVLPELLNATYKKLAKRVQSIELEGPAQPWHDARIAAKRARYTAEALVPVFGTSAKKIATALAQVTEILGEHQDACIAQDVLRDMAANLTMDGHSGFALGLLHEHEFEEELHCRLEFQALWPRVQRTYANWFDQLTDN